MKKRFIFSCGDINGIGPEIVIKTFNRIAGRRGYQFIFICPINVIKESASFYKPAFSYKIVNKYQDIDNTGLIFFNAGKFNISTGRPTKSSGKASITALEIAADLLKKKFADALITAPISKEAINAAGYKYPGHTEMLAEWFEIKNFVMMFLSRKLKASLATIHKPLSKVSGLLSSKLLQSVSDVVINSLKKDFCVNSPQIGVLGLNPHAGESGLIGKEEEEILIPFIKSSKNRKYLRGPFSPDAYWGNRVYEEFDMTLGMYHDQVLIPFKLLNFSKGVNFTAGLPVVRTSPDHGVAYDIAGKNKADERSIMEAFYFADRILSNRNR